MILLLGAGAFQRWLWFVLNMLRVLLEIEGNVVLLHRLGCLVLRDSLLPRTVAASDGGCDAASYTVSDATTDATSDATGDATTDATSDATGDATNDATNDATSDALAAQDAGEPVLRFCTPSSDAELVLCCFELLYAICFQGSEHCARRLNCRLCSVALAVTGPLRVCCPD